MKGSVILIGAGPGSPDLITLRGLRALRRADLVVIDKLLSPDFLDELGVAGPETVWLGADETRRSQDEINRLLVRAARDGKTVVRLKCGDPFVFGRGGEETDYLDGHGVPWELVPGLTAGTAAPSNAGLALTDRRRGRSFAAATARRAGGEVSDEFPRADSLLIFMGVAALAEVAERLIAGGRPRGTAATVIERATLPWERRVSGPLDRVAGLAEQRGVRSPAMLLVGAVAEQADRRPTILYTGLDPANFRALGDIIHWPALCVVRDDEAAAELPAALDGLRERAFDTVVFTSRVGVRSFFRELAAAGLDARSLDGTTVVTAGTGTDRTLREFGVAADIVPDDAGSRGIVRGLAEGPGERVLLVQGTHAPGWLCDELDRRGADVTRLSLHRVQPNPELGRPPPEHDVIYFTSPSGARAWHGAYGDEGFGAETWCIGEVTRKQLTELGFDGKVVSPHVPDDTHSAKQTD